MSSRQHSGTGGGAAEADSGRLRDLRDSVLEHGLSQSLPQVSGVCCPSQDQALSIGARCSPPGRAAPWFQKKKSALRAHGKFSLTEALRGEEHQGATISATCLEDASAACGEASLLWSCQLAPAMGGRESLRRTAVAWRTDYDVLVSLYHQERDIIKLSTEL